MRRRRRNRRRGCKQPVVTFDLVELIELQHYRRLDHVLVFNQSRKGILGLRLWGNNVEESTILRRPTP